MMIKHSLVMANIAITPIHRSSKINQMIKKDLEGIK